MRTLTIANKGTGEILFRYEDQFFGIGPKAKENRGKFQRSRLVEFGYGFGNIRVERSKDAQTFVQAVGSIDFLSGMIIEKTDRTLSVIYHNASDKEKQNRSNKIAIYPGQDTGKQIKGTVNGSVDIFLN